MKPSTPAWITAALDGRHPADLTDDELTSIDPHRLIISGLSDSQHRDYVAWHQHRVAQTIRTAAVILEERSLFHLPPPDGIDTTAASTIAHHRTWLALLTSPDQITHDNDDLAARQHAIRERQDNR